MHSFAREFGERRRAIVSGPLYVPTLVAMLATINLVPLMILSTQFFLGPTLAAALSELTQHLFGRGSLATVWTFILIADVIVIALEWPILAALRRVDDGQAPSPALLRRAVRALNRSQPMIYALNLGAFGLSSIVMSMTSAGGVAMPRSGYWHIGEGIATGLMSSAIMTLQLDWVFFAARRRFKALDPSIEYKRISLHSRLFWSIMSLITFAVVQSLASVSVFADLANSARIGSGGPGFMRPDALLDATAQLPGLPSALAVVAVRAGIFLLLAADLLMLLKMMYLAPVRVIEQSVGALVHREGTDLRPITVVNNDEFAPLFRTINTLITRQSRQILSGERRLKAVVEGAADPILSFVDDGTITVANASATDLFGLERAPDGALADATGSRASINRLIALPADLHPGSDDEPLTDHLGHDGPGITRLVGVLPDGTRIPIEINYSRVELDSEMNHTIIVRDVRAQAETEERLEQARHAAERANALKSEFLANMSHELRTPLNAVLGFSQLLARDTSMTDAQREKLSVISRSGEHLLGLINDILDISKIEAGKFEIEAMPFDLRGLARDLAEMFALRAEKSGLVLDVELLDGIPDYVVGDLGKVRQVLINLLGNAVKFTDEGGVSLIVGPDGEHIRFAVRDTGRGIAADEVERILQPFTQASGTDHEGGTGLGLAISSRFVALMGGRLQIESEPGRGSTFSFALDLEPAAGVPTQRAEERGHVQLVGGRTPRILVVDDKRYNRLVLKEILEPAGCVVMEADNGEEAVARAADFAPDVIFMDIRMPVMDGYAATAAIRANESERSRVAIFALTASAFTHDEAHILASGFDAYLVKPFQVGSIFDLIEAHTEIRFERETLTSAPHRSADATTASQELDPAAYRLHLPADFVVRLDDAVMINDFAAIERLGISVDAGETAPLGRRIRELARDYDERGLAELLSALQGDAT